MRGGVKGQGRGCGRASEEPKCGVIQSGPISDSPVTMDQTPLTAVCPGASPLSDISPEKKKRRSLLSHVRKPDIQIILNVAMLFDQF